MFDSQIANWIQGARAPALDSSFAVVSFSIYLLIMAVLAFYIYKKKTREFLEIFMGLVIVSILTELIKMLVLRPRPDLSNNFSFVSSHAALAFFLAAFLPVKREWKIALYVWAVLVAFSRIWLNLHWLSDVIFGAGTGIATAFLIRSKWFQKYLEKLKKSSRIF
ncbi:MAG: phosphatase PAP2 family protein [archaeon]